MYRLENSEQPCAPAAVESIRYASNQTAATRVVDCACSVLGLLVLAPMLCLIGLAIKLDDGGPVFYFQERVGKKFCRFRLIKFRTMVVGADKSGFLTTLGDSRVTRLGRFLRRYKLDEFPQLLNVLRGDMQLVGARPEVERYVQTFQQEYAIILQERPGITDPASLAYRQEEKCLSRGHAEHVYISEILPRKIHLSIEYQQRRTFVSDMQVLLSTVLSLASKA